MNINMVQSGEVRVVDIFETYKRVINKDNLYYYFMNESVKWFLVNEDTLNESDQVIYEEN